MKRFNCDFDSRFRILKGGKISLVVSALLGSVIIASAAPTGGVVTSGTATITQSGNTTNINQTTQKASINWQNFNVSSNETVNFNQPNVNSITLNRVVGNERSIIDGALNANGQVWILNSNGVLFNSNAKVNTAGLVATTKNMSDADFQNGNYKFSGDSSASVVNMGTIEVSDKGYVALLANTVQNDGSIKAYKGTVHLIGASEATINLNGNSIVSLTVNKGVLDALVENKGAIIADGGKIYLTTNAVDEILKGVVNNSGILEANSVDDLTGHVEVFAHGGTANVSGTINAEAGFVETSGAKLGVAKNTVVKAKTWLLDPDNITIDWYSGTGGITDLITVNAASGDVSVNTDAITAALESGTNVSLEATNDITLNTNISKSTGSDATLTLKAGNNIINSAGWTIWSLKTSDSGTAGNGKLNVVLWADSDGDGHGGVELGTGSIIQTLGGNLWIGGGSGTTTWNGLTVGDSVANGVLLKNTILNTGNEGDTNRGNIKIASKGWSDGVNELTNLGSSNTRYQTGVVIDNTAITTNNLTINGLAENSDGVVLKGSTYINATGALNIEGESTASGYGIYIGGTTQISPLGSTATLIGTSHDASSTLAGILLDGSDVLFNGYTGTSFTLTGNANGGRGIDFNGAWINAFPSDVTLNGTSQTNDGLYFNYASKVYGKNLIMNGTGSQTSGTAEGFKSVNAYNEFKTQNGDLTIDGTGRNNGVEITGVFSADNGAISITGTGQNGYGVYFGSGGVTNIGTLDETNGITILGTAQNGNFAGVYVDADRGTSMATKQITNAGFIKITGTGHGTGAGVNINNSSSRFQAGSGAIPSVTGATGVYVEGIGGNDGVGVNLKGYYFAKNGGVTIKGIGGTSALDGAGHGIVLDGAYIGRTEDPDISPIAIVLDGTAQSANNSGIYADAGSTASKMAWGYMNGTPPLYNNSYAKLTGVGHGNGYGVELNNENILFDVGQASIPNTSVAGLYIQGQGGTTGGGVKLSGTYDGIGGVTVEGTTGASATNGMAGVKLTNARLDSEWGTVSITGVANNSAGNNYGVYINGSSMANNGGSVTIDGTGYGTGYGIYVLTESNSQNSPTSVIYAQGDVTLIGRGKTGTGYNIYQFATQDTYDNSTGMYNNGALNIRPSTRTYLNGDGGSIWLGNTSNDFGYKRVNASNVVDFRLNDGNYGLKLGVISATGKINISTMDGSYANIDIYENITTTSTASDAIVINAGIDQVAGNIGTSNIVYNSGTITAGTGATIKLLSGSYNDSTDLTTLVGTGNGHYRYNSDETTTLSPAIGTGMYAIYREAYVSGNEPDNISSGGSSGGGSIPTDDKNKEIERTITSIVNNQQIKVDVPKIKLPEVDTPKTNVQVSNNLALKLGFDSKNVDLVSQTVQGQPNQIVTLSELKTQENSDNKNGTVQDVRVSLNKDSLISIVNSGVLLPDGVDQEFYVVKQDNKKEKGAN